MSAYQVVCKLPGEHYPELEVMENRRVRYLRFGAHGGWQGALDLKRPERPVFPYQRAFVSLTQHLEKPRRFLSLGVGTGTSLRTVRDRFPACELYGLELERAVVDVATQFFDSPSHEAVNYWIGDGVAFLCNVNLMFNLIFVDAYLSNRIYSPCLDPAFPTVLHAALEEDGVAVCNIIARHPLRGQARVFVQAARALFAEVIVLPVGNPLMDQNQLVVFSKRPGALSDWPRTIRRCQRAAWWERLAWPLRMQTVNESGAVL